MYSCVALHHHICAGTCLMLIPFCSNNEIGSIQPIKQIAQAVREVRPDILFHTDAAQSVGKVKVGIIDMMKTCSTPPSHGTGRCKQVADCLLFHWHGLLFPSQPEESWP